MFGPNSHSTGYGPAYDGSGGFNSQPSSAAGSGFGRGPTPPAAAVGRQSSSYAVEFFAAGSQQDPFGGQPTIGFSVPASSSSGGGTAAAASHHHAPQFHAPTTAFGHDGGFYGSSGGGGLMDASNLVNHNTAMPSASSSAYHGGGGGGASSPQHNSEPLYRTRFGHPEDDLPLLQELGIFPRHIQSKAMSVLHPTLPIPPDVIEDMDLAGPVMFAVALGFLLSLQGKVQFGAIYGLSLVGTVLAKTLLSLMSEQHSVPLQFVVSTLGYCLIPNLILAIVQTFQFWLIGSHRIILPIAFVVITWSSWCATTMFVSGCSMQAQRYLILYPCFLFYAVFAALTIF